MAEKIAVSGNMRIVNENKKLVCSINNVSPAVTANTAAAFVDAIETLYNNGACTARVSTVFDIVRK